jgi:hypothetical protein
LERGGPEEVSVRRRLAVRARDGAGEAFDRFLNERGTKPLDPETAASLLAAGTYAIMVGDLLTLIADAGYQVRDAAEGTTALRAQTQVLLASFLRLADRLDGTPSALLSGARVSNAALREVTLACLQRWRDDPAAGRSALAVVITGEWVQQLGELAAALDAPVAKAVAVARVPWWR